VTNAEDNELEPTAMEDELGDGLPSGDAPLNGEPDVLLDVPELRVDEISLEVENLQAHVALQADVLELLKLHVGVDAVLGRVHLEIKGVEAKVLLKVHLDNVARILDRVLTTIDNNPDIVERLTEQVGRATEQVGAGAGSAVQDLGEGGGAAVDSVAEGLDGAVEDVGDVGEAVESAGETSSPRRRARASDDDARRRRSKGDEQSPRPRRRTATSSGERSSRRRRTQKRPVEED